MIMAKKVTKKVKNAEKPVVVDTKIVEQVKGETESTIADSNVELCTLNLTQAELVHLRDLMSIMIPPDYENTVSQSLAKNVGRVIIETLLWKKLNDLCENCGIATGPAAPDYVLTSVSQPNIEVFRIADNVQQSTKDENVEDTEE